MRKRSILITFVLVIGLVMLPAILRAEEPEPGVARVSLVNGDVSTMRGDSGDWAATTINAPLVQGDKISTGPGSRTEVQLDHANLLRLDQQTAVRIADLSRNHIQVQLSNGTLNQTILKDNEADVEINTSNVAIRPMKEGVYRVQVMSDSESLLVVRNGEAEVSTSQGSTLVKKGQMITMRGLDNPEYQVSQAPRDDPWDDWNEDRDRAVRDAQSYRYANTYYTGVQDLDRYGRWVQVPGYDWVWSPYSDAGWAPYRSGRWMWGGYWGWTWVSYEPWGWAPYHYGRWFWHGNSWCWWPGPVHASYRPIWAPAYVSFLGFGYGGHHWSFGFGFGYNSIGWMPVGPCDYYYPWHGHRSGYSAVNVTNITNIRNVTNIYANNGGNRGGGLPPLADSRHRPYYSNLQMAMTDPRVERGVTAVSTEDFVRGRMDSHSRLQNAVSLRDAQLVRGTVPAVPTRESLRPTDRPVNAASLPAHKSSPERFFAKREPSGGPQPFNQRAAEIQRMVERQSPLVAGVRSVEAVRGGTAMTTVVPVSKDSSGRSGVAGVRAAGVSTPSNLSSQRNQLDRSLNRSVERTASNSAAAAGQTSWQRFDRSAPAGLSRTGSPERINREAPRASVASTGSQPSPPPASRQAGNPAWKGFSRETAPDHSRVSVRDSQAPAVTDRYARPSVVTPSRNANPSNPASNAPSARPFSDQNRWDRFTRSEPSPSFRPGSSRPTGDRYSVQSDERSSMRNDMRSSARPEVSIPRGRPRSYDVPRSSGRPPLQMNKPIVTERSYRGGDGGGRQVTRSDSRGSASASTSRSGGGRSRR